MPRRCADTRARRQIKACSLPLRRNAAQMWRRTAATHVHALAPPLLGAWRLLSVYIARLTLINETIKVDERHRTEGNCSVWCPGRRLLYGNRRPRRESNAPPPPTVPTRLESQTQPLEPPPRSPWLPASFSKSTRCRKPSSNCRPRRLEYDALPPIRSGHLRNMRAESDGTHAREGPRVTRSHGRRIQARHTIRCDHGNLN